MTNMLLMHYGPEEVFCSPEPGALSRLEQVEVDKYALLCGHFEWPEANRLPPSTKIISILRDPIARILSLYSYWRSFSWAYAEEKQDPGILYAKSVGIEEFFFDAPLGIRSNYENAVVRQLVGSEFCAPYVGFTVSDDRAVAIAKSRIDQMSVCGLTEDFSGTAILISRVLGIPHLPLRFDNFCAGVLGGDPLRVAAAMGAAGDFSTRLEALTALDREIFQYASDRHYEKLGELAAA